jgi:hypothetical protein
MPAFISVHRRITGLVEVVDQEYYGPPSIWEFEPKATSNRSKIRNPRRGILNIGGIWRGRVRDDVSRERGKTNKNREENNWEVPMRRI